MRPANSPEFSRPVRIDDLPSSGRHVAAAASTGEREALARRFGLAAVGRLELEGEVTAIRGGTVIRLEASISADVTQTCIVTLAPVACRIEAGFVRLYAADVPRATGGGEEIFYDEEDEEIEPLAGNRIDAGEAAAEQLALELDPYPRAPGAALPVAPAASVDGGDAVEDDRSKPFAGLAERAERLRRQSK